MGTWGPGVFQNDDALDYADSLAEEMYASIEEFFAEEEPEFIDYGESQIIPRLKIFAYLARQAYEAEDPIGRCSPPLLAIIENWRLRYLDGFDRMIDEFESDSAYKRDRRKVIEDTFDELASIVQDMMSAIEEDERKKNEELETWVRSEPNNPDAHLRYAEMCLEKKRWQDCIDHYDKALELGVSDWSIGFAFNNLAWCYGQLGEFVKALEKADRAVAVEHPIPQFFGTRGFILKSTGKFEESLTDYNKALEEHDTIDSLCMDPSLAATHYWRGQVHEKLGNQAAAERDFEIADNLGYKKEGGCGR
ncbi:MAG: tetratricopeptide repeat protein [Cyanobacteria bacterium]|nr:tetratricopeptide repeat protein [Cyanobacteriota bacterium]